MMYDYQTEKKELLTDQGQRDFLKVRDHVMKLLDRAGAFSMSRAFDAPGGSCLSWQTLACIDRLVELEEIIEVTDKIKVAAQDRIFTRRRTT